MLRETFINSLFASSDLLNYFQQKKNYINFLETYCLFWITDSKNSPDSKNSYIRYISVFNFMCITQWKEVIFHRGSIRKKNVTLGNTVFSANGFATWNVSEKYLRIRKDDFLIFHHKSVSKFEKKKILFHNISIERALKNFLFSNPNGRESPLRERILHFILHYRLIFHLKDYSSSSDTCISVLIM